MYTGLTGKLTIAGKIVAYISNWSIENTTDMIEITTLGDKNKDKLPGLNGWSASADGVVAFSGNDNHTSLFAAREAGTLVKCEFFLDDNVFFSGTGYIESLSVDLSAEDKGNISISISGRGSLAYPGKA